MIKSAQQLKDKLRAYYTEAYATNSQQLYRYYAVERFLARVSASRFRRNIVLKGGILLVSIIGESNRATMDVDMTIKYDDLNKENAKDMLNEIISISLEDAITFELQKTESIKNGEFEGVRVFIIGSIERTKISFHLDISYGDYITPTEVSHNYKAMFDNPYIPIMAYPIESILAEKMSAILKRGEASSRVKDYYDIAAIEKLGPTAVNTPILKEALINTLKHDKEMWVLDGCWEKLDDVLVSEKMHKTWAKYQKEFKYAREISWEQAVKAVENLLEIMIGPRVK